MAVEKGRSREGALLFVLQHPLRRRLLRLYVEEEGMLSPKELADFTKQHLSKVGYHVRVLAEKGAVEIVAEQQRRGAVEHFLRGNQPGRPGAVGAAGSRNRSRGMTGPGQAGRSSLDASGTKVMSVRLSIDLADEIAVVARADEVSISEAIRAAIYRHIATRRADERFQTRLREQMERDRKVSERLTG